MAESGIFIGWGTPLAGRERQALAVFNEVLQYYGGLQQRGEIESFEPVNLQPHGGDLGGFLLIRGSHEQINRLWTDAEFQRLNNRGLLVVSSFGVVGAFLGEGMQQNFASYQAQLDDLT